MALGGPNFFSDRTTFFNGKRYEIKGINIGHVIFSDPKITIRSCLEAVVLIEAVNQRS